MSSFGYLKHFPVDYLKIDGSFVKEILHDPIDREMVRSINEIGHLTGKQTIAEFAENQEIINMLQSLGVDYAQGYGVSQPQRVLKAANSAEPGARRSAGTAAGTGAQRASGLKLEAHGQVHGAHMLGDAADGDEIDPGAGDLADGGVVMPPDASNFSGLFAAALSGHRLAHGVQREIVQQGDVGARVDGLAQLCQVLDLDFHRDLPAGALRARQCRAPRRRWSPPP